MSEKEISVAQFVTVPLLDARVAELKLALRELEQRLFNKMVGLGLAGTTLLVAVLQLLRK